MTLSIQVTPEAEIQVEEIDAWWRANRSSASSLFRCEFEDALALLVDTPRLGVLQPESFIPGLRRLLLGRTRFHLFYRVDEAVGGVVVLGVWAAMRGHGPPLAP